MLDVEHALGSAARESFELERQASGGQPRQGTQPGGQAG
jgi:hypothetical protein